MVRTEKTEVSASAQSASSRGSSTPRISAAEAPLTTSLLSASVHSIICVHESALRSSSQPVRSSSSAAPLPKQRTSVSGCTTSVIAALKIVVSTAALKWSRSHAPQCSSSSDSATIRWKVLASAQPAMARAIEGKMVSTA
eukprot:6196413-Pleurochrysis_carterae.AAC.1